MASPPPNGNGKPPNLPARRPDNPWDQQIGEGPKPFRAFVTYRDMANRTLKKVSIELGYANTQTVDGWSARWKWVARAGAYDRHLDELAVQATEQEVRKMAARHARQGLLMANFGEREIQRAWDEERPLDPDTARKLIDTGTKIEREVRVVMREEGNPMARVIEFERVVLETIEQESPEVAHKIRSRLADLATEQTGRY